MRGVIAFMAVTALLNGACTSIPAAHIYTGGRIGYQSEGYAPEGLQLAERGDPSREGRDFCRHLEDRARTHAVELLASGWTTGLLAALAIGAGTVLTASTPDNSSSQRNVLNASLPVAGAVLGYYSFGEFSREKDASDIAATAATAINESEDQKANAICNNALGSWNTSRPNANQALVQGLKGSGGGGGGAAPPSPASQGGAPAASGGVSPPTPAPAQTPPK